MEACAFCDDGVSMCVGVYIDTKYATFVMEGGNGSSLCVPVKTRSSFGGRHDDCSAAAVRRRRDVSLLGKQRLLCLRIERWELGRAHGSGYCLSGTSKLLCCKA